MRCNLKRAFQSWEMDWGGGAHKSGEGRGDVEKVRQIHRSNVMEALKFYYFVFNWIFHGKPVELLQNGDMVNGGDCRNDTGSRVLNQLRFTERLVGETKWKSFSVINLGCDEAVDGTAVQMGGWKKGWGDWNYTNQSMLTGYCYLYVIGMSAVKDGTQTLGLSGRGKQSYCQCWGRTVRFG